MARTKKLSAEHPVDLIEPEQVPALLALVDGQSVDDAAVAANVEPWRVRNWMANDRFRAALEHARHIEWQRQADKLRDLFGKATAAIGRILDDAATAPADKLKAAALVFKAAGFDGDDLRATRTKAPRTGDEIFVDDLERDNERAHRRTFAAMSLASRANS